MKEVFAEYISEARMVEYQPVQTYCVNIPASVSLLSGDGKPSVESLISALKILLASMTLVKPASHRLRGKGLTNIIDTSIYHLSRIKLVSGIRNTGFQFAGIMVSSGKNIQLWNDNKRTGITRYRTVERIQISLR